MSFEANGWKLLFTKEMQVLYDKLVRESDAILASTHDVNHPKIKFRRRLDSIIFKEVPADPGKQAYKQGNTLGSDARHWCRVKFNGRFRLFFWYNSESKSVVFAWLNDENTLRKAGAESDPYIVFRKMLDRGESPNSWKELIAVCEKDKKTPGPGKSSK
ncbi:MAG: type II toxin-antitoxin system YhaV family toxin [Peptococcaceae bacterium]|jgi:toxin YhaV|nr:type II toxin-antitoxin system YhaV family toxin [Peptococcaceae bacterium]